MTVAWRCRYCGEFVEYYARTCQDHRDLPKLDPGPGPYLGEATIQAFDLPESTVYVLSENGVVTATSDWPQPLEELRPDAVRLPCYSSDSRHSLVVHLGSNLRSIRG